MKHSATQPRRIHCDPTHRIMSFSVSSERAFSWVYPEHFSFEVALGYLLASVQNELVERENAGFDDSSAFVFGTPIVFEELETIEMLIKNEIKGMGNKMEV